MKKVFLLAFTVGLVVWIGVSVSQSVPSQMRAIGVDAASASIPLDEVLSGGPPPNGIPAIGFAGDWQNAASPTPGPNFVTQAEAAAWLGGQEPVIAFSLNGETKGYPLQILTWHEIVNDEVGGAPVAVTFCPLCNSALAFDRRIPLTQETQAEAASLNAGASFMSPTEEFLERYAAQGSDANLTSLLEVSFGVSGMLYNSNMLMFDTATSTLWSQLLGEGSVGTLNETQLLRYPAQIVSFAELREAAPEAPILSRETGINRRYGQNPYIGYDDVDSPAFLFAGVPDGRLAPKERVVSVDAPEESVAYPFTVLAEARVVNDSVGEKPVVLFWQGGTNSALDTSAIADGRDVGSVGIFDRNIAGQTLTFSWDGSAFRDEETGSTWDILGRAVDGALKGNQLQPIVHDNTLWFAWAAFKPETRIFTN